MSPPATSGSTAVHGSPKWSRARKVFAVLGALILVFVGGYVVYAYLNGLPPEVLAKSARGQAYLDVALLTLYTPSVPGATDFNVTLTVVLAAAAAFPFRWGNVSGTNLPVRFLLAPSPSFVNATMDGFAYDMGGPWTLGVDRPTPPAAVESLWSMTYTVQELTAWDGFGKTTWFEVDYTLTPVALNFGIRLPAANVSTPSASDLLPTGVVDNVTLSVAPGYRWTLDRGLSSFPMPSAPFQHSLPPVAFDAGSAGNFTATLTSAFGWAKGDDYRVTISGSGTTHGSLAWYWDRRFGSLFTIFS